MVTIPPVKPTRLYKVVARVEDFERKNGEVRFRWVQVRAGLPRGTAEHVAQQVARDGFRIDSERAAIFYPPHRVLITEAVHEDVEMT